MAKMTPYKRAVATTGSYTDRQGNEKKRYTNVGTLFQYDDGGLTLKLDSVPVGEGWNGFISFYEIEDKREGGSSSGAAGSREKPAADLDDDIPFVTRNSIR
jgi:hypothetical protein